jgi:hypothetical protein
MEDGDLDGRDPSTAHLSSLRSDKCSAQDDKVGEVIADEVE